MSTSLSLLLRAVLRRPEAALVVLLVGVYGYFYQAGGWNQNSRFDLVRAVVEDHSFVIDRFEKNTGDDSIRDGHYYSDKAPGAGALCVPTYAVFFRLAGSPRPIAPSTLAWAAWLSIFLAVGVPSALAAARLARLAHLLGLGPRLAMLTALAWSLASMGLPYATLLYGNQLAAVTTLIAFTWLVELRQGRAPTRPLLVGVGALLGFAIASEYPAALIVMPIGLYALWALPVRHVAWVVAGGAIPIALLLAYHAAAFGSVRAFPYDYSVWHEPHTGWFMGIGKPVWSSLTRILVGEHRGLLWASPWLGLAPLGAIALARKHRAELAVIAASVIGFLWLNSSIPPWHGGWGTGPRYLVPMLPYASLLAVAALVHAREAEGNVSRTLAIGFLGLVVWGGANMFVATAVKPEIDHALLRPFTGFAWPHFLAGRLSISTQSIDMIDNPAGGARQAWNLGMKLGLSGFASLVPLASFVAVVGGWLTWAMRRSAPRAEDAR